MVIKIHGNKMSTCTRRVMTVLIEKNVPYEVVPINFAIGQHKSPEFMALQPFGKVPVLEDDGYFVFESRAMCKYIEKKYAGQGTKLMPSDDDVKGYGLFEQACSIEASYFDGPTSSIAFEKVFKMHKGMGAADEGRVAQYGQQLDAALEGYEAILSKQPYLAGQQVSLADLFHLPYGAMAVSLGYGDLFNKYPSVKKWWDSLTARESWAKANE